MQELIQQLEQELKEQDSYLLYGAGVVAFEIYQAILQLYHKKPEYVLVTRKDTIEKAETLPEFLPITIPRELKKELWKYPVVVAMPEIYHEQIAEVLQLYPVHKVFYVDSHLEYRLTSKFYRAIYKFPLLEDKMVVSPKGVKNQEVSFFCETVEELIQVYMVKSHKDVKLKNNYTIPKWVRPIQAGRNLSTVDMGLLRDDVGENISQKNENYCELTVTYWVWKHVKSAYKGIFHYRRMLLVSEAQLQQCIEQNIDVILPLPFTCYPNASGQYRRYISEEDGKCLKKALQETAPEYLTEWEMLDKQPYFYNYNMLIAKAEVFDAYCQWLFPILERAEQYCEPVGKPRADRYAGYLGELLTTLYFMKRKEELNIVHAERNWMV